MIFDETYTLSNQVTIPKLGLGTWFIDDDKAAQAVMDAVAAGYRNIDTAQAYGNERGVGEGVRSSGIPREDTFVSTKLAAEIKNYDDAAAAVDGSLGRLGVDYIDLMLIHSPQPWNDFRGRGLRGRQPRGVTRAGGRLPGREAPIDRRIQPRAAGHRKHPPQLPGRPSGEPAAGACREHAS